MRDELVWDTGANLPGKLTGEVQLVKQLLEMIPSPTNPHSRIQKYRLTQKGRDLIAKLAKETGVDEK